MKEFCVIINKSIVLIVFNKKDDKQNELITSKEEHLEGWEQRQTHSHR